MTRKQIYITNKQDQLFKLVSVREDMSASELIRRALDEYLISKYPTLYEAYEAHAEYKENKNVE